MPTPSRPPRRLWLSAASLALALLAAVTVLVGPAAIGREQASAGTFGSAGSSGTAGASGPPSILAAPPNSLPGIDVSHWQDEIDWTRVVASGRRFAIAKATEGQNFVDPMYASYKAGATSAGLAFTAYHFASPDASANDAVLEADHFVEVAQLGPGNLIPVLDIEKTGGLDPSRLTAWVLAWLGEVRTKLGVRPMVYTSPNGWATRFDDTTAIADAGYTVLWVAHWGVSSPTVPANDWGGNGWTFWQHTDCGNVSGIGGCVDLDWYGATDFAPVTIRRLTVSLGSPDGVITSSPSGIACGTTCSANFDPGATVTLTATPNAGTQFAGWSGACTGIGACTLTMDADKAVTATFGDDTPPTVTLTTPTVVTGAVTATFSEVVHQVTKTNLVLRAQGTSENLPATLTCRSPSGNETDCPTGNVISAVLQPTAPLVPGQVYSAVVAPVGATPLPVDVGGNPMPTTQQDFLVPTDVEQGSAAVSYRWRTVRNHPVYGRSYVVERQAGASVSFAFRGHNVTWLTVTGPSQGKAEVSIDGRSKGTFDQYASSVRYKVARTFKGLPSGEHTITVSVLGRPGSAKAKDQLVAVDAFRVGPTVTATPTLDVRWRTARESAASGGSFASSGLAGASATFTFRGTGVDWYTVRGPNQGRAQILVDGELLRTVDGYAPVATYGVVRSITGLPDDVHTLRIVATGTSRAISTGTLVSVDRFVAR